MRFAPGENKLICDHCGNENEITDADAGPWDKGDGGIRELDFRTALRDRLDASEMEETRVTQCDQLRRAGHLRRAGPRQGMPLLRHALWSPTPAPTGISSRRPSSPSS
jgi:hypothetical protein